MSDRPGYFSTLVHRFGQGWNQFWFTPSDPISLAAVRIGVGLIALYVVVTYGFDLRRFFDPQVGLLPVDTVVGILQQNDRGVRFSYFDYATDGLMLQILHYLGVGVLVAFTVGWQTRITSVLSWLVFLSYFHRGPLLTSIGEPVLALILLCLGIGPSGAEWSVDAWLRRRRGGEQAGRAPDNYLTTVALRLIQVHLTLIYFLMFLGKLQNGFVWWNGTAAWWLIARPESPLVNLRFLGDLPYVINLWTTAILAFEPTFAILIWNRTARPLLLMLSGAMWFTTALITGLVPFCATILVAGLAFVPGQFWRDRSARSTAAVRKA